MRCLKTLALAALATAALMAFGGASSASATVPCKTNVVGSPTGTTCPANQAYPAGTEIHLVSEGNVVLTTGSEFTELTCKKSTIIAKSNNEGSATETVKASIEAKNFTWGECSTPTGPCTYTTVKGGTLEIHWIEGTHNGTLTSNGLEFTSSCNSIFGSIHCIYEPATEHIGTITGGNPATTDIESTPINIISTGGLCPSGSILDVKYEVTSPKPLYVAGHASEKPPSGGMLCKVEGGGPPTGTACPAGEAYPSGTEIHAVLDPETKAVLTTGSEFTEITCKKSTMLSKTENEGGASEAVKGKVEKLTFEECATPNGACTVTTVKGGTLEVDWKESTHIGTLTSNAAEVTSSCASIFGNIHCIYVTSNEDLGTLTGGNPGTTDIENTPINQLKTSGICPSAPTLDAKYQSTTPTPLYVAGHT